MVPGNTEWGWEASKWQVTSKSSSGNLGRLEPGLSQSNECFLVLESRNSPAPAASILSHLQRSVSDKLHSPEQCELSLSLSYQFLLCFYSKSRLSAQFLISLQALLTLQRNLSVLYQAFELRIPIFYFKNPWTIPFPPQAIIAAAVAHVLKA